MRRHRLRAADHEDAIDAGDLGRASVSGDGPGVVMMISPTPATRAGIAAINTVEG